MLKHSFLNDYSEGAHPRVLQLLASSNLTQEPGWTAAKLETSPRVGVWTDDFHNLLRIFDW